MRGIGFQREKVSAPRHAEKKLTEKVVRQLDFFDVLRLVKTMFHDVFYGGRRPATVKVSNGQHTQLCPTTLLSPNQKHGKPEHFFFIPWENRNRKQFPHPPEKKQIFVADVNGVVILYFTKLFKVLI
ncbi:hypothetical protein TNCT_219101 [Trichonephila clavata]|uniref:Uncharacterized protein n=1 Tax=Trichonephila clavata TaxID=2740835 RepID=A0A8X6HL19_TRICU|nr:hypothetical protein TNCT_219101 [Trichonephila clavata]